MIMDAILIDAGTGNLHSVQNALLNLGYNTRITANPADLATPARLILPGVGAFGCFMDGMRVAGLVQAVRAAVQRGDPLLGICVGMQALFDVGLEMGEHPGLGLLRGQVVRFPEFKELKVPHTGWNQLHPARVSPLLEGLPDGSYAYFNHSFYCAPHDASDTLLTTDYGIDFTSAVQRDNIFGVQFHPEKSQLVGQKILANFFKV
jgi:glutamine amidotransferase